jgi:hypothetical protein
VPDVDNESLFRGALTVAYENAFDLDERIEIGYSFFDDPGLARLRVKEWVRTCSYKSLGDE